MIQTLREGSIAALNSQLFRPFHVAEGTLVSTHGRFCARSPGTIEMSVFSTSRYAFIVLNLLVFYFL
jgi:hypothetical protein